MIDVPYEDAVSAIEKEASVSREEIESRVKEKLEQLSGLISKEGAIHIVANELGVQLVPQEPEAQTLKIKDVKPGMRNITVTGRVVQKWEVKEFERNGRKGRVANLLIGDETGVTKLVFWNDQVDVFQELNQGDILVVRNPFAKQGWQDRLELQLNDQSQLAVNPEGVTVAQRELPERAPREQKYIKDLQGGEQNAELIATVVQVYDPRFYDACGECRRKLVDGLCPEHGEAKKDVNFNLAAFLDDGTGNVRTSFWKQQALVLTGLQEPDFLKFRDDPSSFESVKNELLGEIIKVVGAAKKNETFDRLEFTAQLVFKDVDPAKELQRMEQKPEKQQTITEEVISLDDLE